MIKGRLFLAFVIGFSIFLSLSFAFASDQSKIESSLLHQFESSDHISVLINVKPSQSSIDSVVSLVGKSKVIRVFGVDSILADLDRATLDKLAALSFVKSINSQKMYKPLLQDAVPLIDADLAWQNVVNGLNVTGVTQTVCVIDGGVNFSHFDLASKNVLNCNLNCDNYTLGCYSDCSDSGDSHGTRVAGIVAANGGIKGVATGANLVGIDVFDSNDITWSSLIRQGFDFCVSNASLYNISVISMSLGADGITFNDYCDDFDPTVVQGIDNAVAKNISVVISAGNDGDPTGISSPACAHNAIPVGATNKSDYVASYSNYYSHLKLFAPGSAINSTSVTGGYAIGSGTSFSAPMVSASIAMINQVLKAQAKTMTPKQIEDLIFNNSDPILDLPGSFKRININNTIAALLAIPPQQPLTDANITTEENTFRHLSLNNANLFFYAPFDFYNSATKKVHDFSANNFDGSVMGGVIYKTTGCLFGNCFWFDGLNDANDDYLNFSTLKNSNKFGSSFTVSMWVKNNESSPYIVRDMIGTQSTPNAAGKAGWVGRMSTALKPQFVISNGTRTVTASAKYATLVNQWSHVVFVYDASVPSARVYVDNVAGALKSGTLYVPKNGGISNTDFRIGMGNNFNKIWRGNIDEVMIFDKALNATQITDLYKNQSVKFYSVGQKVFPNVYAGSVGTMVNITLNSTISYPGTNYTIRVGSQSGNGYNYGSEYNVVNGNVIGVPISTPSNLSIAVIFHADPQKFYSPLLVGNVTATAY